MDADRDSNAPRPEISAHVASCVIRVRELDPSLKFTVTCSRATSRFAKPTWRCSSHPTGFTSTCMPPRGAAARPTPPGSSTCRGPTDTESDLQEFAQRLRAYDPAVFSHTENGVTVIEGLDPDGGRVLIGYPSPFQLPRTVIAARLHA